MVASRVGRATTRRSRGSASTADRSATRCRRSSAPPAGDEGRARRRLGWRSMDVDALVPGRAGGRPSGGRPRDQRRGGRRDPGSRRSRRASSRAPDGGDDRPHRRPRGRQVDARRGARARVARAATCGPPCSPSTRPRRTRAERCSGTGSACRSTPPTRACSSDRWPPAAISAAWRSRRPRRPHPRRGRVRPGRRGDGGRGPGGGRRRRRHRHRGRGARARHGRRRADGEGGHPRGRRRLRREQGRPRRRPEVVRELRQMLHLGAARDWDPPVLTTSAIDHEGVEELWEAVESHRTHLAATGALAEAPGAPAPRGGGARRRAVPRAAAAALEADPSLAGDLAERRIDPYGAAAMLVAGRPRTPSAGRPAGTRRPVSDRVRPDRTAPRRTARTRRSRASPSQRSSGPTTHPTAPIERTRAAGSPPYTRGSTPRCTGAACGRCASSPATARPPRRTRGTASCSTRARAG